MSTGYDDLAAQLKVANEAVYEAIQTSGTGSIKVAEDVLGPFVKRDILEESLWDKVLPVETATNDMLSRSAYHDLPVIVGEMENAAPASDIVPFGTQLSKRFLRGSKFEVTFARIQSPSVTADVDKLRTYVHDIRQVVSDKMVKNMAAAVDTAGIRAVNTAIVGPNVVCPTSGVPQWRRYNGGITRSTVMRVFDNLPSTPSNLPTKRVVINNLTVNRLVAFDRAEWGGDVAEEVLQNGFGSRTVNGSDVTITIKKGLVPTGTFYTFGHPAYMGKNYELQQPVMYVKREMTWVTFGAYMLKGGVIANTDAVGRVDILD